MEGAVDRVMMRRLFGKPSWAVVAGVIPPLLVLVIVGVVLLIRFPPGQMAYIGLAYMLFPLFMLLSGLASRDRWPRSSSPRAKIAALPGPSSCS